MVNPAELQAPVNNNVPPPPSLQNVSNQSDPGKKYKVEIIRTDFMELQTTLDLQLRRLVGNVIIKQGKAYFYCDSAWINVNYNTIDAFGKVHIEKDTIDIWGDKLFYNGDNKTGNITGSVKMKDNQITLKTPYLDFDLNDDFGIFRQGGEVVQKNSTLTSESGVYYSKQDLAVFNGNVVYKDKKTTMYADSMRYDTKRKVALFITKTHILTKDSDIWTDAGYYDTQKEKAFLEGNTILKRENGTVTAGKIEYDGVDEKGLAENNVVYVDTSEGITVLSDKLFYQSDSTLIKANYDPFLIKVEKEDTLYISADTLYSYLEPLRADSLKEAREQDSVRILYAYYHTKVLKGRMSAICDSLYFSYQDSIIQLFKNPVVWIDTTQFSADTILIYLKNNEVDYVYMSGKCMIISQSDPEIYNQVKGRVVQGYFNEGELDLVKVHGNAESLYFIKDDSSAYVGANKTICSQMDIYFQNDSLQKIVFLDNPEGSFNPMQQMEGAAGQLDGFFWWWDKKPKTKYDIVRNGNKNQIEYLQKMDAEMQKRNELE